MHQTRLQLANRPYARVALPVAVGALSLLFFAGILHQKVARREPVYDGRPISYWFATARTNAIANSPSDFTDGLHGARLPVFDSNAVPYLIELLHHKESKLEAVYQSLFFRLPLFLKRRMPFPERSDNENERDLAVLELSVISRDRKEILPVLVQALASDKSGFVRSSALVSLLPYIRQDGSVSNAVASALRDKDPLVRGMAAQALGVTHRQQHP